MIKASRAATDVRVPNGKHSSAHHRQNRTEALQVRVRALIAALLVVCAISLGAATSPAAAASPRLVFERYESQSVLIFHLYSIRPDGTHLRQLTHGALSDTNPDWSPDRRSVVFAKGNVPAEHNPRGLYKVRADGTQLGRIRHTRSLKAASPAWSPNGRKIAFVGKAGGHLDIYVLRPDGSHLQNLTRDAAADSTPAWSPSGRWIVFGHDGGIWKMHADGTHRTMLTNYGGEPSWAPNGGRIAFSYHHPGPVPNGDAQYVTDIFTMLPTGRDVRNITNNTDFCGSPDTADCGEFDHHPSWSPDNARIAVGRSFGGYPSEIDVIPAAGGDRRRVYENGYWAEPGDPSW